MLVNEFVRRALRYRKDHVRMRAAGWEITSDFDWRLNRGGLMNKRIAEVKIAEGGKEVWYRLEDDK